MTKMLDSFAGLADVLAMNSVRALAGMERAMEGAAKIIQHNAQDRIGEYQQATGPFPEWEPLADSTEAEKARLGYPTDAPLLRTGQLRDSIETEHSATEAIIGSKKKEAAYQEFGTEHIPPRPFLGPAAYDTREKVHNLIGAAVTGALVGGDPVHPALGYDREI